MLTMIHISPSQKWFRSGDILFSPFGIVVFERRGQCHGFPRFFLSHSIASLSLSLSHTPTSRRAYRVEQGKSIQKHEAHILSVVFMCMRLQTWFCVPHIYANPVSTIFACTLFFGWSVDFFFFSFYTRSVSQRQHLPYLLEMWFGIFYSHSFFFASFLMHAMVVSDAIAGKQEPKKKPTLTNRSQIFSSFKIFFSRPNFMRRIINKWLMTANDDGCYTVFGPRLLHLVCCPVWMNSVVFMIIWLLLFASSGPLPCFVSFFSQTKSQSICIAVLCPRNWSMFVCISLFSLFVFRFGHKNRERRVETKKNGKCSRGHALWFSFNINMYDGERLFGVFAAGFVWVLVFFRRAGRHHSCHRVIVSQRQKACNLVIIIGRTGFACVCAGYT